LQKNEQATTAFVRSIAAALAFTLPSDAAADANALLEARRTSGGAAV
jgi:hypothetical protein